MIDPATGWFEIVEYNGKQSATIANIVEKHGHVDIHRVQ